MYNKDYYIILSMVESINKVFRYTYNYKTAEEFFNNSRDFDATMMNFIILGENVNKLSDATKEKYQNIDWNKVYGLRNIIAHHYFGINVDIVWEIIQNDLLKLNQNLKVIAEKM